MTMTNRQTKTTWNKTNGWLLPAGCVRTPQLFGGVFPKWNETRQINRNVRRSCNGMMPKVVRLMGWISRDRLFTYITYMNEYVGGLVVKLEGRRGGGAGVSRVSRVVGGMKACRAAASSR